ncbi:hypothetical protein [Methanobacterium subterraneum]|nr:hypothetical protein [Methanobacterium subterraneum]
MAGQLLENDDEKVRQVGVYLRGKWERLTREELYLPVNYRAIH